MPYLVPMIWIVLAILLIVFLGSNIVIVPQAKAFMRGAAWHIPRHMEHRPAF